MPVIANSVIVEILEEDLQLTVKRAVKAYGFLAAFALLLELAGYDGLVVCRQILYATVLCLQVFVFRNMWESIKRGNIYAFDKVGLFLSSEDYFLNPIRCRIVDYERDDGKRVVVNDVIDTIPSTFFTPDPIETIDSASTCDELIAIFQ